MALNDRSTAHLVQYSELELLFVNNGTAVGSNTAFLARRGTWGNSMLDCYKYRDGANASTKGFTKAKKAAKLVSSKSAASITGKAVSYAITKSNTQLETEMKGWTQNFIYRSNDGDFAGVIQKINDTLSPFITSDPLGTAAYFTALQLSSMQSDKTTYTKSMNLYKNALSGINIAKGNFSTLQIPIMEEDIVYFEGFLPDMSILYPDFVTAFKLIVEKINSIGKRNQGASAVMTYAGSGVVINSIGRLEITNYPPVKVPKIINTNTNGVIPLLQLKIGTWNGLFTCPDCIDQHVIIKVTSKKITAFNIAMVLGTNVATPVAPPAVAETPEVVVPEVPPLVV